MGNLFYEVMPQRKLSDLILPDKVLQICQSLIQEQHRTDLLRSYNLEPRNRILLIGPLGNGKTSLAEAIAKSVPTTRGLHVRDVVPYTVLYSAHF